VTKAECLLAYFDANQVNYELVDGRVKLTGALRVPAEMIAQARQAKDDIAKLLISRIKETLANNNSFRMVDKYAPVKDRALLQKVANERNLAAEARGGCDRYCACQRLSSSQWRDRKTGKLIWICDDCLDPTTVSGPVILQRTYNNRQKSIPPPMELKHVPPPAEHARDQWWTEFVQDFAEGRIILRNITRDECVEIELRSDQP
jgi:hypothetical protein